MKNSILLLTGLLIAGCRPHCIPRDIHEVGAVDFKSFSDPTFLRTDFISIDSNYDKREAVRFIIRHRCADISKLIFKINISNKPVFIGKYSDTLTTPVIQYSLCNECYYTIWIEAMDTVNSIYYSWGEEDSHQIRKNMRITLLPESNSDDCDFVMER